MGKGGRADAKKAAAKAMEIAQWTSPYKPLDPKAPEMPTKGQIKAVIPEHCFEKSYFWGFFFLFRDFACAGAFIYAATRLLSTEMPPVEDLPALALWTFGWSFYAVGLGTIMFGPWICAHECGHGAFSPSQALNDFVGYFVHGILLVPYFAWQYSHAKHHRRTNHLTDGESHVPDAKYEIGFYHIVHEALGDGAFAALHTVLYFTLGYPLYLLGVNSTGKLDHKGQPLKGIPDHFRPFSPMFPAKVGWKIALSTIGQVALLSYLGYLMYEHGALPVILWYWGPYMFVNAWLVLYTWLQHTDPSVPHYGEGEWTWVKGTLGTIDRPYGIFDHMHHRIGSTHVVHHLFHELPHWHAKEATEHVKAFLEPMGLYNYDPTPLHEAVWKCAMNCHYVEDLTGVQYYKSFRDLKRESKKVL
jgi:omega-6 fatty acid desaturase (delta-12 desaturase)